MNYENFYINLSLEQIKDLIAYLELSDNDNLTKIKNELEKQLEE